MKIFKTCLAVILISAFGLGSAAFAGQRAGAFSVSPMLGYHTFEGDQDTDDAFVGGLALGYNLNKRWAIELDFRQTQTDTAVAALSEQEDVDIWTVGLNALYHFNPDGKMVPYITAGFGGMTFKVDGFNDDEDFMMNWGVGAKFFLSENTALRLDLRHILDFHSDRAWDRTDSTSDKVDNNLIAMAGLYWQFGGVAPPPPPPADSDRDGIPDLRDKCPDTPLGTKVDAVGCPPVERKPVPPPAKFVDGDDDGDGVPNSRDKCPGTPRGVIVDADGCPIKFSIQIEFDFDKAVVRPQYHDQLREAAAFIRKYPDTQFLLAGHTDSRGSDAYNEVLSKHRAAAVKKYLVEEFGIGAQLLHPRGYGESQPIATNETDEGRQHNRRVEVICCVVIPEGGI